MFSDLLSNLFLNVYLKGSVFVYLLIILGMIIEGDTTIIFSAFATHLDLIGIHGALISILAGALLRSNLAYLFGYVMRKREENNASGHIEKLLDHKWIKPVARLAHDLLLKANDRRFWAILLSKFMYGAVGISLLVPIFLSYKKMRFYKFALFDLLSSFIWIAAVFTLAYFLGAAIAEFIRDIKHFIVLAVIILMVVFLIKNLKVVNEFLSQSK